MDCQVNELFLRVLQNKALLLNLLHTAYIEGSDNKKKRLIFGDSSAN